MAGGEVEPAGDQGGPPTNALAQNPVSAISELGWKRDEIFRRCTDEIGRCKPPREAGSLKFFKRAFERKFSECPGDRHQRHAVEAIAKTGALDNGSALGLFRDCASSWQAPRWAAGRPRPKIRGRGGALDRREGKSAALDNLD